MKKKERNSFLKTVFTRSTEGLLSRQARTVCVVWRWLAMGVVGWSLLAAGDAHAATVVVQEF